MIRLLAFAMTALFVTLGAANARVGNERPSNDRPSAPSAPVDPASFAGPADRDPPATGTNYAFVEDGSTHRKVVSDFCYNWRSDRYCVKN